MVKATNELYWQKSLAASKKAIRNGTLSPIETKLDYIKTDLNLVFEKRILVNDSLKFKRIIGPNKNPFSPWEKELEIDNINLEHVLILNKYPVQIGHMLLITRNWKPQNGWLDMSDWAAIKSIDIDTTGLWFFNSCKEAGASQTHRHIQLLRREDLCNICPLQNLYSSENRFKINNNKLIDNISSKSKDYAKCGAKDLYDIYLELCSNLDLGSPSLCNKPRYPYNILLSPSWVTVIRRSSENAHGFSLNALAFAGYLLNTDKSDNKWLKQNGPIRLLEEVVGLT